MSRKTDIHGTRGLNTSELNGFCSLLLSIGGFMASVVRGEEAGGGGWGGKELGRGLGAELWQKRAGL